MHVRWSVSILLGCLGAAGACHPTATDRSGGDDPIEGTSTSLEASAPERPTPATSSAPSVAKVNPVPTTGPSRDCAARLETTHFQECNPHPSQHGYPECWMYDVVPAPGGKGGSDCLPRDVDVFITGWQAISDQRRARVVYEGSPPVRARLVRSTPDESPMGDSVGDGSTDLGTLQFEHGTVSELVFGSGMPSHLHTRSLHASTPF